MFNFAAIFTAVLTIVVGLLFIDLVALQENAVCVGNYTNATTCPEVYFSQSYLTSREKFLSAARSSKAEINAHSIYKEGGMDYTIDTAFLRGGNPKRLLVHISGTHGVEGYSGSAVQFKLLHEWNNSRKNGPSVLFIHALNPYGMAHFRRFNENNVDLNRNYLSKEEWKKVLSFEPNRAGYENVRHTLLLDRAPRFFDRYAFIFKLLKSLVTLGTTPISRAVVTGQYHHPEGIFFGGKEEQRSITTLREILKKYSAMGEEESVVIDFHTGLGPEGVDTMLVSSDREEKLAKKVFRSPVQYIEKTVDGTARGYDMSVGHLHAIELLGKNSLIVTEEFGTVHGSMVLRAIILENAAYHHAKGSYTHEIMKTWLRDAFYPQKLSYKKAVLKKGMEAFEQAWEHLARA